MRKPKRPRDPNALAFSIVANAPTETYERPTPDVEGSPKARGKRGGLKGGDVRAATPEQRSRIAKKAAAARWRKSKKAYP